MNLFFELFYFCISYLRLTFVKSFFHFFTGLPFSVCNILKYLYNLFLNINILEGMSYFNHASISWSSLFFLKAYLSYSATSVACFFLFCFQIRFRTQSTEVEIRKKPSKYSYIQNKQKLNPTKFTKIIHIS